MRSFWLAAVLAIAGCASGARPCDCSRASVRGVWDIVLSPAPGTQAPPRVAPRELVLALDTDAVDASRPVIFGPGRCSRSHVVVRPDGRVEVAEDDRVDYSQDEGFRIDRLTFRFRPGPGETEVRGSLEVVDGSYYEDGAHTTSIIYPLTGTARPHRVAPD